VQKATEEDEELQKRQVKTIQFLHSIGYDKTPQSITERDIQHLNSNPEFRNKL
jgi:hypothetical protein